MAESKKWHGYWQDKPKDKVHEALWPYARFLETQNSGRLKELLRNHGLYGHGDVMGFQPFGYFRPSQSPYSNASNPTVNLCESMVDTAANRIAGSTQTAIEFVTTDGDYTQQRMAKNRTKVVDAEFYRLNVYDFTEEMITDAGVYGEGYLHPFEHDGRAALERAFPAEMMVDALEALYGNPRQLFRKRAIPRLSLQNRFKSKKAMIAQADAIVPIGKFQQAEEAPDLVAVVEAWILPSSRDAKDGWHAIVIENGTIVMEPYEDEYFPFVVYRWKKKRLGWYGQSIVSSVARLQGEVNQYMRVISRSHYTMAVPRIWAPPGSGFNPDHFTREIGSLIESVVKPEIISQQILPPETYEHLSFLIAKAYETIGISANQAAARKSPGIVSGVAIEAEVDLQSDRLANPQKRYEKMFVELAQQLVGVIKRIAAKNHGHYETTYKKGRTSTSVDWRDSADLDEDALHMQVQPFSALMKQVPGKLEMLNTQLQLGVITKAQYVRALSDPDVDALIDPQSAKEDLLNRKVEDILDHGMEGFDPPEPFDDLDLSKTVFLAAYNKAKLDRAPPEILDALRQYLEQVIAMTPPPMAQPQLPGLPGSHGPEVMAAGAVPGGAMPAGMPTPPLMQ